MGCKVNIKNLDRHAIIELSVKAFGKEKQCRLTLEENGRIFLSHLFNIHVCKCNFTEVRNRYIEESERNNISDKEDLFYKDIASYYLGLHKEPKEEYLKFLYISLDDLETIDDNIKYINNKLLNIDNIKKSKGWLNGEERYERNSLEYYRDKNKKAKNEILDFITHHLENYTLSKCSEMNANRFDIMQMFIGSMPYSYSRGKVFGDIFNNYDIREYSPLINKFFNVTPREYVDIKNLYHDNKKEFFTFAKLRVLNITIKEIKELYTKSHVISKRKKIFDTIINHYKNKDYLSVVNMLPMQIEGVFTDFCIEIGIEESKLDISSINEKLRIIVENTQSFYNFEYYSFTFPIIRNQVAHGKLIEGNLESMATFLMLDLLPVCNLTISDDMPFIRKIKLIEEIESGDISKLIDYLDYIDVEIDGFYKMKDKVNLINEKYKSNEFWEMIDKKVMSSNYKYFNKTSIFRFLKKLQGKKICVEQSDKFLKSLPSLLEKMKENEKDLELKFSGYK